VRIRLRLVAGAGIGFGAAEIAAGLMPTYVAFALLCPVIGVFTLTMLNSANATMQLESAPALRGRVMALYMTIVMGGTPIGSPFIGWVGEQFGARWTLLAGGVLTIVGVIVAVVLFVRPARAANEQPEALSARAA
jgi:MFS family permease